MNAAKNQKLVTVNAKLQLHLNQKKREIREKHEYFSSIVKNFTEDVYTRRTVTHPTAFRQMKFQDQINVGGNANAKYPGAIFDRP